jgi:hypothetical protein
MKHKKFVNILLLASITLFSTLSSIPTGAAASSLESTLGHNFDEEYWSVLYDFAGEYLEKDYNPGTHAGEKVAGLTDNNTNVDNKYFGAYTNMSGVQSLYLALQNNSWGLDAGNNTLYGCNPYQVLIQHSKPPGDDDISIVTVNSFLGLIAYQDNKTAGITDVVDENDQMYLGWSYYSELHKFLVNLLFWANDIPSYMHFDNTTKCTATPIPIVKTGTLENTTLKYGMSYRNIFVLWQKMEINETLGSEASITGAKIVQGCSAFALLEELNFTFVQNYVDNKTSGIREVKTTTEYDIGKISDLWVVGDDENISQGFNGQYLNLSKSNVNMGYYNTTNVTTRLSGNATIPGFSLAVVNTANMFVIDHKTNKLFNGNAQMTDPANNTFGSASSNLSTAQYAFNNISAYKMDFASKPNYTFNGVTEYAAPTRVLKNDAVKINTSPGVLTRVLLSLLAAGFIGNITGSVAALLITLVKAFEVQFYYLTCFPVWSGGTINQDPVFSAFVDIPAAPASTTTTTPTGNPLDEGPGGLIVLFAIVVICGVVIKKKKGKKPDNKGDKKPAEVPPPQNQQPRQQDVRYAQPAPQYQQQTPPNQQQMPPNQQQTYFGQTAAAQPQQQQPVNQAPAVQRPSIPNNCRFCGGKLDASNPSFCPTCGTQQ